MATVPNRYYNSPWIAQAAANLTDALFGSPERDYQRLQAENLQAQMERQRKQDAIAEQARSREQGARQGLAGYLRSIEGRDFSDEDYAKIGAYGVESGDNLGNVILGIIGRRGITGMQQAGANTRADASNQTKLDIAEGNNQTRLDIAGSNNQTRRDIAGANNQTKRDISDKSNQTRIDVAKIGAEQKALDRMARKERDAIRGERLLRKNHRDEFMVDAFINTISKERNVELTPEQRQEVRKAAISGNMSADEAWDKVIGDAERQPGERGFFGFGSEGPGTYDTPNLGNVVAAPPPAASASPLPSSAAPPKTPPPAAIQFLQQNPTPQNKAFFVQKYGSLPPGM